MTIALIVFAWWLIGFIGVTLITRDSTITWGDLAHNAIVGLVGPLLPLLMLLVIFVQADFWQRPIFGSRDKKK